MSHAVIVFARMDSHRLPGKALADLGGRPMLGCVIERVRRARSCAHVIVATSARAIDDPIAAYAASEGIAVHRGATDDVAGRALAAATGLDAFVRISGDSPFVAPEVIDAVCAGYAEMQPDIATNVFPRTYPPGCSVEVIRCAALARAHGAMNDAEREHVSAHFYAHEGDYCIHNVASAVAMADVRLTVDTADELARARLLLERLGPRSETAPLARIVAAARALATAAL